MAILTVSHLKKVFGTDVILEDVSFEVQENEHIGLVGVNGSGKTTLCKLLTGEYTPDEGGFALGKNTALGYMEQHVCHDLDRSAYQEVLTVFQPLIDMEAELEQLSAKLLTHPANADALILRQTELNDRFARDGGLTYQSRARSALLGLGFRPEQIGMPVGILSGGQKAKLQLAKMLLCGANLLLLDEPTNHLDITAVEWLEDFLKNYNGAYLVISHDRYFLDAVTTRTFEVSHHHLTAYKGNYTRFLALKEEHRLAQQRVYDSTVKEINRLEGIIAQQRRWNQERNYVTIASKQKSIDRLEATLDRPEDEPDSIRFQFKASQRGGNDVLTAENLSLGFDGKKLFSHANMEIKRQQKVFLVGPNGCGKTSFLKILLGEYQSQSGFFQYGAGIDVGYYDQIQRSLHDEKTVIDEIWDLHPTMTQSQVRGALAVFLFQGEDVFKPVSGLSGGERARVLLLKLMLSKANFLILDEPTNHLDIDSCEALEDALSGYDGTMLVVSHDRYLINKLADKIYYLDETGLTPYIGNYDDFLAARQKLKEQQTVAAPVKVNEYKLKKECESALRRKRGAISRLEADIAAWEEQAQAIGARLELPEVVGDYEKIVELTEQLNALHAKTEAAMEEWGTLSDELEQLEKEV